VIEEVKSEDDESPSIQKDGEGEGPSGGFDMQSFHIKVESSDFMNDAQL